MGYGCLELYRETAIKFRRLEMTSRTAVVVVLVSSRGRLLVSVASGDVDFELWMGGGIDDDDDGLLLLLLSGTVILFKVC